MNDTVSTCPDFTDDRTGALPCTHYIKGGFCTTPTQFRCPEYILHNEPALSYTAVSDYAACHRKFYWTWVKGVEPIEKSWAMQQGLMASKILGYLHDAKIPWEQAVAKYQTYIEQQIEKSKMPEDDFKEFGNPDLWKMKAVFDGYILLGLPQKERGTPEYEFRWNFDGLPKLHGYIDMVHAPTPPAYQGWEYKYTGNPANFDRLLIMDQLITYFIADPRITTMINRCLCYPGIYPGKGRGAKPAENVLDFYQRCKDTVLNSPTTTFLDRTYYRNEFDFDNYKTKISRVTREIMSYIREGGMEPFYQNKKACLSPYRCDFLRCCENDLTEPWTLTNAYRKKNPRR